MNMDREYFEEPSFKAVVFSEGDVFVCASGDDNGGSSDSNGGETPGA